MSACSLTLFDESEGGMVDPRKYSFQELPAWMQGAMLMAVLVAVVAAYVHLG